MQTSESNNKRTRKKTSSQSQLVETSMQLGKVPPQSTDLEEVVLGALMLEQPAINQVADLLTEKSFYKEANQKIFKAILNLYNANSPIDLMTVTDQLRKNGTLEVAGGAHNVAMLTMNVNSSANIEHHARIILEKAMRRDMIFLSSQVLERSYEDTDDIFEILEDADRHISQITERNTSGSFVTIGDAYYETFKEMEWAKERKERGEVVGVPSGIEELDKVTGGFQNSKLYVVAARPGMGKSAFVMTVARNASVAFDIPVAIFSLEMPNKEITQRLMSSETDIYLNNITRLNLKPNDWETLQTGTARLVEAPLYIDDQAGLNITHLKAKARRLARQQNIRLIIVDYLQLMKGDSSKNFGSNREQEIASISRGLKELSKELDIPVIALSQLSRAVESRAGDKRPQLSDLRESGAIEQDADCVMFLFRPEYYDIMYDEEGNDLTGKGEVIIAKHRQGGLENIVLNFDGPHTKWYGESEGLTRLVS